MVSLSHLTKKVEWIFKWSHRETRGCHRDERKCIWFLTIFCSFTSIQTRSFGKILRKTAENWTLTFKNTIFQYKNAKIILVIWFNHIVKEWFHTSWNSQTLNFPKHRSLILTKVLGETGYYLTVYNHFSPSSLLFIYKYAQ